jgi:hypothetical protein
LVSLFKHPEKPLTSKELTERIRQMKKGDRKSFCVQLNDINFQSYAVFQKYFDQLNDHFGLCIGGRYTIKQKYIALEVWIL